MKKIVASTKSRFSLAEAYTDSGSNESAREALDANGRLLILAENGEDVTITAAGRATEKSERVFADVADAGSGSVSSVTKLTADDYMNMDMYNSIALTDDLANPSTYMNVSSQKDAATIFGPVVLARYGYATVEFYTANAKGLKQENGSNLWARVHFSDKMIQPGVPAEGLEMPAANPDFMPGKLCGRPFLFDFIVRIVTYSSSRGWGSETAYEDVGPRRLVIPKDCVASEDEIVKALEFIVSANVSGFYTDDGISLIDERNGWEEFYVDEYIHDYYMNNMFNGDDEKAWEYYDIEFGIGSSIRAYYSPQQGTIGFENGNVVKPIFDEKANYLAVCYNTIGLITIFLMPFFRWCSSDGNVIDTYLLRDGEEKDDITIANDSIYTPVNVPDILTSKTQGTGSRRKYLPVYFRLQGDPDINGSSITALWGKTFNVEFIWDRAQMIDDVLNEKHFDFRTTFYERTVPLKELRTFSTYNNYDGLPEIDLNLNASEKRNETLERFKNEFEELYPLFDMNPNPVTVRRAFKSKHSSAAHAEENEQQYVDLFHYDYVEGDHELVCEFGGTASDGYQHYTLRVGSAEQATIDLGLKRAEDGLLYFTLAGNEVTSEKKIYIYGSGPDVVTINTVTNEHGYEGSYFGVFVFPYNVKLECTLIDEASGKLVYTVKKYSTGNDEPIQELVKSTMVQIPGRSWWPAISEASAGPIEGFYMCDRVVVQAEFERFCDYADMAGAQQWNAPVVKGDNLPATGNLWWQEALVYCNARSLFEGLQPCYSIGGETDPSKWPGVSRTAAGKLKCSDFSSSSRTCSWVGDKAVTWDKEANGYRLPTLREWLYAAYGSISTKGPENNCSAPANKYPAGDDWLEECILYDTEAKSKKPNDIGIYDLIGLPTICWPWNATNAWSDDVLQGRKNPDETGDYAKWWPSVTQLGSFGVSMQTDRSRKFMFRVVRSRMTQN